VTATPTSGDCRSQKQRMPAGDLYIADDREIAADWLRCALLAQEYNGRTLEASAPVAVSITDR
jgi:hypothetical protein